MQVGRSHDTVMGRIGVLGEIVTEVSAAGFPINEKLALPGAVLDPIEAHIDGFGYFFLYGADTHYPPGTRAPATTNFNPRRRF